MSRRGPPPPPPPSNVSSSSSSVGGGPSMMGGFNPMTPNTPVESFFTPSAAQSPGPSAMGDAMQVARDLGEMPGYGRPPSSSGAGGGDHEFPLPAGLRSSSTPAPQFEEPQFHTAASSSSSTPAVAGSPMLRDESVSFYVGDPLNSTVAPNEAAFPNGIVPEVQNVVSTVDVRAKLDLEYIAANTRNSEYNPRRFAAVIMRIREPKTTALIFSSGKIVCTGARSEYQSKIAARKYARILEKLGNSVRFTRFKVQNVVASCDVQFPIRLDRLAEDHNLFATYEPELFPGLVYKMHVPKVALLIFVSGKVVLTGAKTRQDIYEAFCKVWPLLSKYRKQQTT